jgi:hypothetical protein
MSYEKNFDILYLLCSARLTRFTIYAHNRDIIDPTWKYPNWLTETFISLLTFIGCKY